MTFETPDSAALYLSRQFGREGLRSRILNQEEPLVTTRVQGHDIDEEIAKSLQMTI